MHLSGQSARCRCGLTNWTAGLRSGRLPATIVDRIGPHPHILEPVTVLPPDVNRVRGPLPDEGLDLVDLAVRVRHPTRTCGSTDAPAELTHSTCRPVRLIGRRTSRMSPCSYRRSIWARYLIEVPTLIDSMHYPCPTTATGQHRPDRTAGRRSAGVQVKSAFGRQRQASALVDLVSQGWWFAWKRADIGRPLGPWGRRRSPLIIWRALRKGNHARNDPDQHRSLRTRLIAIRTRNSEQPLI
jgi:hypothetical protein